MSMQIKKSSLLNNALYTQNMSIFASCLVYIEQYISTGSKSGCGVSRAMSSR